MSSLVDILADYDNDELEAINVTCSTTIKLSKLIMDYRSITIATTDDLHNIKWQEGDIIRVQDTSTYYIIVKKGE